MEITYSETQMPGSQALGSQDSATNPGSVFVSDMNMSSSGRQVLLDRTNDSLISGLSLERGDGTEAPASNTKGNPLSVPAQTSVTDEILLLYKAKTLVQRVDSSCIKPASNGYQSSPTRLLAPTPTNTPESVAPNSFPIANSSSLSKKSDQTIGRNEDLGSSPGPLSSVYLSETPYPEAIDTVELPKNVCSPEKPTTRTLLFESVEKDIETTVSSPSSIVSSEDSQRVRNMEDDNVSQWSVQVNFSSPGPEQQVEDQANETDEYDDEQEEGEAIEDEECEELCQGLNKISVHDNDSLPPFAGRHTRFVYNSDDEIETEEEVKSALRSPSVMHLRGMPTPRGKHLRFSEGDADSANASN
ncbi:hypothetical protein KI387_031131 [Taxus chinensis]|uniref:Uncharacterized protein n=1 Tax=Taxus chinensis TaxID=29808 RepID=A0AA38CMF4_TAXCH|nr:hypothetical protein KI387_031131 [Taxus chinensis]